MGNDISCCLVFLTIDKRENDKSEWQNGYQNHRFPEEVLYLIRERLWIRVERLRSLLLITPRRAVSCHALADTPTPYALVL